MPAVANLFFYGNMTDFDKTSTESPTPLPINAAEITASWLKSRLIEIEEHVEQDILVILGNIQRGLAIRVRLALERIPSRRKALMVILNTPGGLVEETKVIVETLRNFYSTVHFLIPVEAMSAGTVLVMSGDEIYMDYFSRLGPIDPQIQRGDAYIPALSYLRQYTKMVEKAEAGKLTTTDMVLIQKMDLAELDSIELAKQLSESLITDWLSCYKFKNWTKNNRPVSDEEKRKRANEIAQKLNEQQKWFVHGHGIHMSALEKDLRLRILDYSEDDKLKSLVWRYFWPAAEYSSGWSSFVHSKSFI